MIEIKEVFDGEAMKLAAERGYAADETSRVFSLTEDDKHGIGIMGLEGREIVVSKCESDGPPAYARLLLCAMLAEAARCETLSIRLDIDGDFSVYGFKQSAGHWVASCRNIKFPHECKGEI